MPPVRGIVVAAALTLASACANKQSGLGFPPRGTTGKVPGVTAAGTGTGLADGLSLKQVAGKEEPATLIAEDRSRCTVPASRFRNTEIGSRAICDWRTGER